MVKSPLQKVKKYQEWVEQKLEKSAVILYDTMWDATRVTMGKTIATEIKKVLE